MADDVAGDDGATESQKVWRRMQQCIRDEDFDGAIQLCNSVRSKSPDDVDAVRVKALCLINQDKYDKALQSASGKHKSALSPERAYCLFRLERLEEALDVARGGRGSVEGDQRVAALAHLEAQILYRLGRHAEAAEAYADMSGKDDADGEDTQAVAANTVAAYAAARNGAAALEAFSVEDAMEEGASWEFLYNLGTASLQRVDGGDAEMAESCLVQAEEACKEALVAMGLPETQAAAADEVQMVACQRAHAEALAGNAASAVETLKQIVRAKPNDQSLSLVSTVNLAALEGFKDSQEAFKRVRAAMSDKSEKGLLPTQLEACRFARCLLLLQCGKTEDCQAELETLREHYPKSTLVPRLEAALLSRRGRGGEASELLESRLSKLEEGAEDELSLRLCLGQLYANCGKLESAIKTLEGARTISGAPAAASILAGLYTGTGDRDKAATIVEHAVDAVCGGERHFDGETKAKALLGMADWFLAEGFHQQAAETYTKVLDLGAELDGGVRVQAQASLVIAYSYFNSGKLEEEASKLPYNDELGTAEGLDPLELEMTELPRSSKARKLVLVDKTSQKAEKRRGRRDPQAVLRKRAKRRAKYIAKLVAEERIDPNKPLPKPDPERWIPRSQRSYGKRGRKRNKFVGAQGSGDGAAKDTAKLDALAKAQAKKDLADKAVLPPGIPAGRRGGKRR